MKALLLVLITLVPRSAAEPELRYVSSGLHKAINPLTTPVIMKVDCGMEFEKVDLKVYAGTSVEVLFQKSGSEGYQMCSLESYRKDASGRR